MSNLTKEEKELLESFERDEWHSKGNLQKRKKQLQKYAKDTFKKTKSVNVLISEKDLEGIQIKALEEGIPYKVLIASILHKYLSGELVEESKISQKLHEQV